MHPSCGSVLGSGAIIGVNNPSDEVVKTTYAFDVIATLLRRFHYRMSSMLCKWALGRN
jgi:hypothetical protein